MAENAEIKVDSAQEVPEVKPVEEPVKQEEPLQTEEKEAEKKTKRTTPCKLGYCIFNSAEELVQYFKMLMKDCPKHADMNEYEHMALLDLLKQHPEWDKKVGPGIKSFQVRDINVPDGNARAFVAMRKDGSMEDFSYIKCASQLYPGEINSTPGLNKRPRSDHDGGRGGRGGGRRGGGGRGRGGGGQGGGGGRGGGRGRGGRR